MDLREVFATNLRRLRHEKGLSQDDLAYEAEVSRSYLSQLEKGSFHASLKIVGKLAACEKPSSLPARERRLPSRIAGPSTSRGLTIWRRTRFGMSSERRRRWILRKSPR